MTSIEFRKTDYFPKHTSSGNHETYCEETALYTKQHFLALQKKVFLATRDLSGIFSAGSGLSAYRLFTEHSHFFDTLPSQYIAAGVLTLSSILSAVVSYKSQKNVASLRNQQDAIESQIGLIQDKY